MTSERQHPATANAELNERVWQKREAGASWLEIQAEFNISRQQARYAYQLGKRKERRRR